LISKKSGININGQIGGQCSSETIRENKHGFIRLFFSKWCFHIYSFRVKKSVIAKENILPFLLNILFAVLILIPSVNATAQIQQPQSPGIKQYVPINPGESYSSPTYNYHNQISNGNNSQTIIDNTNRQAINAMGYNPPVIPPSKPELLHQFIVDQYNQSKNPTKQYSQLKQFNEILNDEFRKQSTYSNSINKSEKHKNYAYAFNKLVTMLNGGSPLSVKDAYFQIESAFGNSYLSYNDYNSLVKKSVDFIKNWLLQNGYNLSDNNALNIGIQRFMSDTLTITVTKPDSKDPIKKVTHLPFFYDYDDFQGERDFRNYFSTKTLATGSGQCNSLPAVYLILAEGLRAKAYLTFAPMHSFIKYPNGFGNLKNYEPTSNWNINDRWYVDNLFISSKAIYNRIYLDTLSKRQIVANCLIDLAHSYLYNIGAENDDFLKACVTSAMKEFPRGNNINAYFINSSYLGFKVKKEMRSANITDISMIATSSKGNEYYKQYLENERVIAQLGYQDFPVSVYEKLMSEHEFKGRKQVEKNISGKEKRNQFIETH
jgi:hypothetical protein